MRVTDKSQPLDKQQAAGKYFFISLSFFFLFFLDFPHARPTQHHIYRSGRSAADLRAGK
jgi:hypothetical protein|nr:MAG TPA: hypothetical protein [Caudoviricetes sp.]